MFTRARWFLSDRPPGPAGMAEQGRCQRPSLLSLPVLVAVLSSSSAFHVPGLLSSGVCRPNHHNKAIVTREYPALAARRGRGEYVEDRLPEEEDELGDEVSKIIGYESREPRRRRDKSGTMQWLKDLYYKIFWFGLDLGDEDDDEYLDEIDWFGGFRGADEEMDTAWDLVGGKEQPVYRGSFPFDMQVFPPKRSSKGGNGGAKGPTDSVVKRRTGVREETPLWENTASPARDVVDTVVRTARRSTRPPPPPAGRPMSRARKVNPSASRQAPAQLEVEQGRLEEKRQVLKVSRDVWKKRIADMLTSTQELDEGKLGKARARLQQINQDLADVDIELKEVAFLLDMERRRAGREGVAKEEGDTL